MELAASFSTPGVWARSAPSSTHPLTGSRNLRRPAHHHPAHDSPPGRPVVLAARQPRQPALHHHRRVPAERSHRVLPADHLPAVQLRLRHHRLQHRLLHQPLPVTVAAVRDDKRQWRRHPARLRLGRRPYLHLHAGRELRRRASDDHTMATATRPRRPAPTAISPAPTPGTTPSSPLMTRTGSRGHRLSRLSPRLRQFLRDADRHDQLRRLGHPPDHRRPRRCYPLRLRRRLHRPRRPDLPDQPLLPAFHRPVHLR